MPQETPANASILSVRYGLRKKDAIPKVVFLDKHSDLFPFVSGDSLIQIKHEPAEFAD